MFPIVTVTLTDERKRRCAKVLRDALRDADISLDLAAQEVERNVRQVARQLAGDEGSLTTLFKLPDHFWRELGLGILAEFGYSKKARAAARARAFVIGKRRQLRMAAHQKARKVS